MELITSTWDVLMADGTEHRVTWDQREVAAVELMDFPDDARMTKGRYMVYHSMSRQRLYEGTWEKFTTDCVAIEYVDVATGDGRPNPGRPGPAAGHSSISPSDLASRSNTSNAGTPATSTR